MCPTRELAAQVAENFDIYAKNLKLSKALLIGGVSFKEQEILIDKGVIDRQQAEQLNELKEMVNALEGNNKVIEVN